MNNATIRFLANTTGFYDQDFYLYLNQNGEPTEIIPYLQSCLQGYDSPLENFLHANPDAEFRKSYDESSQYKYQLVIHGGELFIYAKAQAAKDKFSFQGKLVYYIEKFSKLYPRPNRIAVYNFAASLTGDYNRSLKLYGDEVLGGNVFMADMFVKAIKMGSNCSSFAQEFFSRNEQILFYNKETTPGEVTKTYHLSQNPSGLITIKYRSAEREAFSGTLADYLWDLAQIKLIGNELESDLYSCFWDNLHQTFNFYQLGHITSSKNALKEAISLAEKLEIYQDISHALEDINKLFDPHFTDNDPLDLIETRYREIRGIILPPNFK